MMATSTRMQGICAALVFVGAATALAQTGQEARAPSTLRRHVADSVKAVLNAAIQERAFPGAFVVVGDSRGVWIEQGVGRLDWKKSPRPANKTLWDLASLTKVLGTTTALAQLVERGQVRLDGLVQEYLPEWSGAGRESITVRHLLTHASGLPSFRPYDTLTHDPDSLHALLFNTLPERAAGERMVYSDIGAFIMGEIIERVSRLPLDRYVDANIAKPLRLRETMFNPPPKLWKHVAPTEFDSTRGGLVHGKVHDERAYYLGGVAAHAGLFGSARDLARFATMMLRGGVLDGARILKPETIALFTAYADSAFSNRALGWQKPAGSAWAGRFMSSRAYGHTGFTGTSMAIDPELDLYIILLSNRVNPTRNNAKITDVRRRLADAIVASVRQQRGLPMNAEVK